ncbi:MAG: mechanosensitive ion channel protein MscS [Deltaproteobacteria bacterium]|nr:mechanosensitive ion channel protein MscS [Deltaproteobacteria bacterium]
MPETAPAPTEADSTPSIEPIIESLPAIADWLPESIVPVWELVSQIPIVGAVAIAIAFFMLALALRFAIFRSLGRLAVLTTSAVDDRVLRDLRKPIFTTILFPGLALAVAAAQLPIGSHVLVNLLFSVVVASWMRATLHVSSALLSALEKQRSFTLVETRTIPLFDLTIKLLTILIGSYVLLLIWGINPLGWLASAGIVGIAVGFAAKDTLANLFSGFFIVADAPYKIGDYINLDSGERGQVSAIGLRSTRLLTRDDVEITIPNGVIANAKIVNESGGPYVKIRNRISVGVAYGSDVDRVCELLQRVGREHSQTCSHPEPRVRLRGFGASSLDFELLVWIEHPEQRGLIAHDLYMDIYKTLGQEGIEIPFTKHDVFIKELPSSELPRSDFGREAQTGS